MIHVIRAARRARAARARDEAGFTLLEVIVSIGILIVAMAALLTALVIALQATVIGRANQQAGDVVNAELEKIRSYSYAQVTLATGDATLPGPATYAGETVAVAAGGAVAPAQTTFAADNRTYTVRRWVTNNSTNADGDVTVRRVTVEVTFTANGKPHTRRASTLVTNTRRGLPLPNFRFDYSGSAPQVSGRWRVAAAPGSAADFGFVLRNLGARDTWNLTSSQTGWTFYLDANQNGVRDTGEALLTDTDASGQVDTAPIEPSTAPLYLVANRAIGAAESGALGITFTATSSAQPAGGVKTVLTTLDVTTAAATPTPAPSPSVSPTTPPPPCTGGSPTLVDATAPAPSWSGGGYSTLTLTLQNGNAADSATRSLMSLSRDATTQLAACNFSTDVQTGVAGRVLTALTPAAWDYTPARGSAKDDTYTGTAVVKVWVKCPTSSTPTITATVGLKSVATHTATGSTTISSSGCNGSKFTAVPIQVPGADLTTGGAPIELRIRANATVAILYDAPGAGAYLAVGSK